MREEEGYSSSGFMELHIWRKGNERRNGTWQWRGGSKRTRLPISIITQKRDSLQIPFHSIDFIHKYPFVFDEFLPDGIRVLPHFLLTGEALNLDAEQCLVYQSDTYKKQTADRFFWCSWWYQKPTKSHLASLIAWNGIWIFLIIIKKKP